jgi:signal transduction histidine kinase
MVLQTYSNTVRLGQREVEVMAFVSSQVALSIERKRAEETAYRRAVELKALYDTSLDIISTHHLPTLLEKIVVRAASLLGAPSGGLYLCDPIRNEVSCVVSYNTPEDYTGIVLRYGEGAAGIVAQTGQPLIIDDYRTWSLRSSAFEAKKPFTATLSVPLIYQGEVRGVIHALDRDEDRRFSENDLAMLTQFANQAVIAIENARLLDTEREQRQRESALLTLMRVANSTLNLSEVIQVILEHLLRLIPCEAGSVLLLEEDYLLTAATIGFKQKSGANDRVFPLDQFPINHQVITTKRPVSIDDVRYDSRYVIVPGLEKARSFLGLPLIFKNQIIGMITMDSWQPTRFQSGDIELAQAIADHAAISIENARLYKQVQRHAIQLEERVTERTAELSQRVLQVEELNQAMATILNDLQTTNRQLEYTTQKLQAANAELESFAYSVSHDLKAPLRGINGYSFLLIDQFGDKLNEEGLSFLQSIRNATEQMGQLIEDLLSYSRLERRPMTSQLIDMRLTVNDILSQRAIEINQRHVKVSLNLTCAPITADVKGVSQALRNLIDNSLKFTRDISNPSIEIGDSENPTTYLIWVTDNGIGFDIKFQNRIYEIFQRLHTADQYPGTGIGLSIVRKVMQRMNGRTWAESEPGKGATFYLEFPK